jgi:ubiquinone/menaquinone biosynthesis C-methylase UbiE
VASSFRQQSGVDGLATAYGRLAGFFPAYERHLRLSVQRMGLAGDGPGLRLLDVGCGTGTSTRALLSVAPRARVVGLDASLDMVVEARAKEWPGTVRFIRGRVEQFAEAGISRHFDGVFVAYTAHGLDELDRALEALFRVMRPGAPIAVHDCSVADSVRAKLLWSAVCWGVVVPVGAAMTGHPEPYGQLWRQVRAFDDVVGFERRLARAGFVDVRSQTMPGWERGIVYTWLGRRPG